MGIVHYLPLKLILEDPDILETDDSSNTLSFYHYVFSGCADQQNDPLPHKVCYFIDRVEFLFSPIPKACEYACACI